jgi:hypothetical protein
MKKGLYLISSIAAAAVALAGCSIFNQSTPVAASFALPESAKSEPWPVQSGLKVQVVRDRIPTVDRVVLVPDEATFLQAISEWSLQGRWPILIEDDTYTPMFLRRFQAAEVIHLEATGDRLPEDPQRRRQALRQAVATAWEAADPESLPQQWQAIGWEPPGVAIASETDPAWPAAVALAADRGQPLVFLDGDFGTANDQLTPDRWQALNAEIEQKVEEAGYPYKDLGDAIDTVVLARELAVKYQPSAEEAEPRAVTDGLGRHRNGERWAVFGWIYGSAARSLYQAMSSIFLDSENALLYDSYRKEGTWLEYEMTDAAAQLHNFGLNVTLVERPESTLEKWQQLSADDWNFDLVWVNSLGGHDTFSVGRGEASVDDIPTLQVPAAVHFIHSWSTVRPDDLNTVAGRWLQNGAYVYVGSVHEPYLSAFIPPKLLVRRVLRSSPLAIAARQLESDPWKITIFGDPLMRITPPRTRISAREFAELQALGQESAK